MFQNAVGYLQTILDKHVSRTPEKRCKKWILKQLEEFSDVGIRNLGKKIFSGITKYESKIDDENK